VRRDELLESAHDRIDHVLVRTIAAPDVDVGLGIGWTAFVGELLEDRLRVAIAQLRSCVPA
jgi:hypothetical protein